MIEFYAYLAGLIDGEGCFLVHKHANKKCSLGYSWQISMTITQNNNAFLQSIINELGYGQLVNSRAHFIAFSSNYLRKLIPKIAPYLRIKKPQAELVMEALSIAKLRIKHINMERTNQRLEEIELELKKLKGVL